MAPPNHPPPRWAVTLSSRRAVLGAGLAGGAAALLAGCDSDDTPPPAATSAPSSAPPTGTGSASAAPDVDPQDWDSVQAQFLLDPALAQFAAFVLSPHTKVLDAAIAGYRDELGVDTEGALIAGFEREQAVRTAAAAYHGGGAEQYALTDSTTMGLGLMYGGLELGAGDEVLTTTHDFYSTEDSLRLLRKRTGASIQRVTLYDDPAQATVDEMVERAGRRDHAAHQGGGADLGALLHGRAGAGGGDLRGPRRAEQGAPRPVRRLRRRGARVQRRRRGPARPRLRLPRRGHPQVAVRAARHRHPVGPQTSGR